MQNRTHAFARTTMIRIQEVKEKKAVFCLSEIRILKHSLHSLLILTNLLYSWMR